MDEKSAVRFRYARRSIGYFRWLAKAMPDPDEGALLSVIDQIYGAVERPEIWPQTVYAIGELIGGRRGFWGIGTDVGIKTDVNRHLLRAGSHAFFLSRKDLEAIDQYTDEFGAFIARLLQIIFLSTLWLPNEATESETIALAITRRYLAALGPTNEPAASLSRSTLRKLIAALWEEGCVFGEDNLRCMRQIGPHLDRALRLQVRLASRDLRMEMMTATLDCLTLGIAFVDRSGRPLWLNKRAREIIAAASERSPQPAGPGTRPAPAASRALRELIEDAMSRGRRSLLALNREDGTKPLLLMAVLLDRGSLAAADKAVCAVVFICDPERTEQPSIEMLRRGFALTYREAQMAIAVAQGHGLRSAAEMMGVAMTTARSQLQQAFAKTGTRHQAELAGLVHRMLAGVRPD